MRYARRVASRASVFQLIDDTGAPQVVRMLSQMSSADVASSGSTAVGRDRRTRRALLTMVTPVRLQK